ncbi:MAG: hypothetical protein JSW27_09005 [Phycisphaerales bacterium]|nr:MAG: hypothetical protein JSW27_09005 [Phycisphaerales bacterium]
MAQNAVKHGLSAHQAVIVGEDVGEFEFYRDRMLAELAPEGAMESMLADRAVGLAWRLQRAERLQNEAFDALYEKDTTGPLARLSQSLRAKEQARLGGDAEGRDLAGGRVVVRDFANSRVLDRLLMYERRLEHSLFKTMTELQRLRLLREVESDEEVPTPRPTDAEHSAPDRAKQTQSASASTEAKSRTGRDVRENHEATPAPKQSQSKPISPAPEAEQGRESCPNGGAEVGSGSFQSESPAVYSVPSQAGCDLEHSTGTAVGLR